ncbi:MAG: A24 family peptidase [Bryobacteraceae bacterium]
MMNSIALWPTVVVVAVATATDIRTRRIPNWLVVPFLVAGLVVSAAVEGWPGVGRSLAGVGLAAAIFGASCFFGAMGMGDLKLGAAVGAWIGPDQLMTALVITGAAGGVIAVGYAIRYGLRHPGSITIPYAPAIAVGTVVSFFAS